MGIKPGSLRLDTPPLDSVSPHSKAETSTSEDAEMNRSIRSLIYDDSGQDLIEYALLATLISIGAIALVSALGATVASFHASIGAAIPH